jgi:hypothetical protein
MHMAMRRHKSIAKVAMGRRLATRSGNDLRELTKKREDAERAAAAIYPSTVVCYSLLRDLDCDDSTKEATYLSQPSVCS